MSCDPFVRQLADLSRSERIRAKWVLVPSHAVGLALGDRLAREGCDWVDLRFATPLDLATRMAAPFLVERGIDPSEETLGPAVVMRLLLALPEEGGYFRPMAVHTSMAEALWRTIRELRYAGVEASAVASGFGRTRTPSATVKARELVALLTAYEQHLEAERVADMPAVFTEAERHLEWSPIAPGDLVVEVPDTVWPPLVRHFIDSLPGARVRPHALGMEGLAWPARVASLAATADRTPATSTTDAARLCALLAPASAGSPANDGTLTIFHAGGRDAELDEVLRRIVSLGRPLDHVEIVCSRGVPASLVWEKATRLAWPVTIAAGLPGVATRPGRLLLRLCDWIESGFEAATLRVLLQSGDLAPKAIDGDVSPVQAARLLLKAQATWGRATYRPSLTRRAEEYERRASGTEIADAERGWSARKARQTRAILAWLDAVFNRVPEPDERETVGVSQLADAANWFVDSFAGRASAMDAVARDVVVEALKELRGLGDYRCSLASGLRFLKERVESVSVGRDRARPGHLHVSSLRDAGHDGRPLIFVVGLEEGAVFASAVEDAVLLDAERRAIGSVLPTASDRQDEEVATIASRLGALGASCERITLSYSCRDTREFRETFPSWIVLHAFRLQQGDASLTYDDLATRLPEPASSVPASADDATTDAAWWLARRHAAHVEAEVLTAFPSLAHGRDAVSRRTSDEFTEYDGFVAEAGGVLDPSRTRRPVSPTSLEDAAKCPLRFFMRNGLGVWPIEEAKADRDGWLAATTRGTELHALFARIMRTLRAEKRKPLLERDRSRLREWGRQRLDALRAQMPPPSDEVFVREAREFLEDLDAFITAECEGRHGREAVGFEVPFGFPSEDAVEPLARPDPIEIDIGDGRCLVLHGWIDRINKLGPGEYEVADYKSSYWPEDWEGEFAGGTRLQHAIYGVAAARALRAVEPRARVVRGIYLFPTVRGHRQKKVIAAPSTTKLLEVLRGIADVLGSGVFAAADKEGACRWCEFKRACHAGDNEVGKSMLEDEDNVVLRPYADLRSRHE